MNSSINSNISTHQQDLLKICWN